MRLRRRPLSHVLPLVAQLGLCGVLLAGCSAAAAEQDQWTIWVTTDAPVPQLVDRALLEVLDDRGELACADCRRQVGVPTNADAWPISFGVAAPVVSTSLRVRVRLYRALRAGTDGLPAAGTAIDRVARLPPTSGNTDVQMLLSSECLGLPSEPPQGKSCSGPLRALDPEKVLDLGKPDGATRPGTWPRAAAIPCTNAPDGMVCVPGGFLVLGDLDAVRIGAGAVSSRHVERFVSLSPFAIDRDEVHVGAVRELVRAGRVLTQPARRDPLGTRAQCTYLGSDDSANDEQAVNCVTFDLATEVCVALGRRLPTEAEWEWVAGNLSEETRFPWGELGDSCDLADVGLGREILDSGGQPESSVCRFRAGRASREAGVPRRANVRDITTLGVLQLAGGLSEWTADRLAPYDSGCWQPDRAFLLDPRCDDATARNQSFRGAAWIDSPVLVGSVGRQGVSKGEMLPSIGFRCAVSRGAAPP
jgi:formylglycine-generating enzyme